MKKADPARRRAFAPYGAKASYCRPQVLVTISLDKDLYRWLRKMSGTGSFTHSVETTIETALRSMRGDLPLALLLDLIAHLRETTRPEVLFGQPDVSDGIAELLIRAARIATGGTDPCDMLWAFENNHEQAEKLSAVLQLLMPERNLDDEMAQQLLDEGLAWAEERQAILDALEEDGLRPEPRPPHPNSGNDDDIPF